MACNSTKCSTPTCNTYLPACKLIRGKCPKCAASEPVTPPQNNQNVQH